MGDAHMSTTSPSEIMDVINLNGASAGGNNSNDDDVVVGVDEELLDGKNSNNSVPNYNPNRSPNPFSEDYVVNSDADLNMGENEKTSASDVGFFRFEATENEDLFADRPMPEWVGWGRPLNLPVGGSGVNPFEDYNNTPDDDIPSSVETPVGVGLSMSPGSPSLPNGTQSEGSGGSSDSSKKDAVLPSLFEEDAEFVGVELDGSEKTMDKALKEGIVGEAGALKRNVTPNGPEKGNVSDSGASTKEFNDSNYWRVDQEIAVSE